MVSSKIITHRGLEPNAGSNFPGESTLEAFESHLQRFDGIEFDLQLLKDKTIVVSHDNNLSRITKNIDSRDFNEINFLEFKKINIDVGTLGTLDEVFDLIRCSKKMDNAIHLKGVFQKNLENIDLLTKILKANKDILDSCFIFDVIPEVAKELKLNFGNQIKIAASVSHDYDILRFNKAVNYTLLGLDKFLDFKDLYSIAWLDEWDLKDSNLGHKKLYTEEVFNIFKKNSIKIAIVSPELHGTSPNLLGGEQHEDTTTYSRLFARIEEILKLNPDYICTDYPMEVKNLLDK